MRESRKSMRQSLIRSQLISFVSIEFNELKAFAEEQEILFKRRINHIEKLIKEEVDSLKEHDFESYNEELEFQ